jgi:hypothetical protein
MREPFDRRSTRSILPIVSTSPVNMPRQAARILRSPPTRSTLRSASRGRVERIERRQVEHPLSPSPRKLGFR